MSSVMMEDLSSDYRHHIEKITPHFSSSLKRAFRNRSCRDQKLKTYSLDDVFYSSGDTKIELLNLRFPWIPDFRIIDIKADLRMLCLDVSFKLGDLRIEGDYEAHNLTLQSLLPVSSLGKLLITFKNVTCTGRVGLIIVDDFFLTKNYDVLFTPTEVSVRVSYYMNDGNPMENEITSASIENTLGKCVWIQLNQLITDLLDRQLGDAVADFSVQELLADQDDELRVHCKERAMRANRLLDCLLCRAKDTIVAREMRMVSTPGFQTVYRGRSVGVHHPGNFQTGPGYLQDLATVHRAGDISLFEDEDQLVIYGDVALDNFKHGYFNYKSTYEENSVAGAINSSIYQNKIFVKITVHKIGQDCKTKLDLVQIRTLRDIHVDTSGLGSLSWLSSRLKSWVIGNLRNNALAVLEGHLRDAFEHAIRTSDCVDLLID